MRKLGIIDVAESMDCYIAKKALGPDALEVSREKLAEILHAHRGVVRSTLMDQTIIAGLGNIYTDEILFQAGIHPKIKATHLTKGQVQALFQAMGKVLHRAIEKSADPNQFPGWFIIPLRKEGLPCPKCRTPIEKVRVSSRSTYYCANCQIPE